MATTVTTLQTESFPVNSLNSLNCSSFALPGNETPRTQDVLLEDVGTRSLNSQAAGSVHRDNDGTTSRKSMLHKAIVVFLLSALNFTGGGSSGIILVGLPKINADLAIPEKLSFWPSSVFYLSTASTLLLAGSIADAVGAKLVDLIGMTLSAAFMLGAGGAQTGSDLVVMRSIQGIGFAMHLSSSVSLLTRAIPRGKGQNIAFGCLGLSQALGFSSGLVLGGIFVDGVGWRVGFYIYGGVTALLALLAVFQLPQDRRDSSPRQILHDLKSKVDWVGAMLASTCMTLLCYLLAVISASPIRIKDAENIAFLCISVATVPVFVWWMNRQVRLGQPALIPNKVWKNVPFSTICGTILLSFVVCNGLELFSSLFYQNVQHLPALQASLRLIPSFAVGVILNFVTGVFVDKIPAIWIVVGSSIICAVSPLLMAIIQPDWPYWGNAFIAQLLQPISADALFTVGLVIITGVFPDDTQALAGAVFNTTAQFGSALSFAILQVISSLVTKSQQDKGQTRALLEGYKASFWAMFAMMVACAAIGAIGLRKAGKVGLKQD